MALPRFMYDDPSKHVDFVRRKREQYESSQESKADKAKQGLEDLFKEGKRNDAQ